MTTIAFKDGIMAADGKVTIGNQIITLQDKKIFETNGYIVGTAGNCHSCELFREYGFTPSDTDLRGQLMEYIESDKEENCFYALVWDKEKKTLKQYSNSIYPLVIPEQISAIGSGADFALGAMYAGASADKAVEIASKLDINSGGEIYILGDK